MTARIKGFRTRSQLRMRAPRSVSRNITPQNGGVAVHYGGPTPNPAPVDHAVCESIWRSWQNYHMDGQKWADIAYTAGYCNHNYVLAGRGYGIRTAANGTTSSNQNYYAFVWIGGGDAVPNEGALDALEWLIADARRVGGAGNKVKPHSFLHSTRCPGNALRSHIKQFDGKPISVGTVSSGGKYLTEDGLMDAGTTRIVQIFLGVDVVNGEWDAYTVKALQHWVGAVEDTVLGPETIGLLQKKLGMENITRSWNLRGKGDPTTLAFEQYLNRGIKAGTFTP